MRKTHPRWKIERSGKEKKRIRVYPRDCPACNPKCPHCGEPFTVSTAYNEQAFCSMACERKDTFRTASDDLPIGMQRPEAREAVRKAFAAAGKTKGETMPH